MRAFGQGGDEGVIAAAGGFEDGESFGRERFGPVGDGVTSVGKTLQPVGRQISEIEEGARKIAADNELSHGEDVCPCHAGSIVPRNCLGSAKAEGTHAPKRVRDPSRDGRPSAGPPRTSLTDREDAAGTLRSIADGLLVVPKADAPFSVSDHS